MSFSPISCSLTIQYLGIPFYSFDHVVNLRQKLSVYVRNSHLEESTFVFVPEELVVTAQYLARL